MINVNISDNEWKSIANKLMLLIVPMVDFNSKELLNNIEIVFGKEMFDSRFTKGAEFITVLKKGVKNWR